MLVIQSFPGWEERVQWNEENIGPFLRRSRAVVECRGRRILLVEEGDGVSGRG